MYGESGIYYCELIITFTNYTIVSYNNLSATQLCTVMFWIRDDAMIYILACIVLQLPRYHDVHARRNLTSHTESKSESIAVREEPEKRNNLCCLCEYV